MVAADVFLRCAPQNTAEAGVMPHQKYIDMNNLFSSIPDTIEKEIFEDLLKRKNVRIERILSKGQSSPPIGWFDQKEHEWVIVLDGCGIVSFEDGREIKLKKGDYLNIPARVKHKVKWTDPDKVTIWLAIFYKD